MIQEEILVNRLILHSNDTNAPGLLRGQMGAVVLIATYAKQKSKPYFDHAADFLYAKLVGNISERSDIDFASGLAGIGWGIEYLTQAGILPGSGHEICSYLDKKIMERDIRRIDNFSLECGLGGLWAYVSARVQGNMKAGLEMPFDMDYLKDWKTILIRRTDMFPNSEACWLERVLRGQLDSIQLDFRAFVKPITEMPETNLSLVDGLAGYIALNYLKPA